MVRRNDREARRYEARVAVAGAGKTDRRVDHA